MFALSGLISFYTRLTFRNSVNHGEDLVIPEAVYLKSLGRANSGTYSASMTFDLIVSDFALIIDIRRIKGTNPEAAKTGHA